MNYKVGSTMDIIRKLRTYNTGKINDTDLKYFVLVKNRKIIERCVKRKLKKNQVIKNREIYRISPEKIKRIVSDCYCENVSLEEQTELADELGDLMKLYSYTKNKVNIKPFIIIGDDLI